MGKVYLDGTEIGSFAPQNIGSSGTILLKTSEIGSFALAASGTVYLNSDNIGSYVTLDGKVWVNGVQVGTFSPELEGSSGDVLVNSTNVGSFIFSGVGYAYTGSTLVGLYCAHGYFPLPGPAVIIGAASITPPPDDILELKIHLGCTKEVSSFDCLLQNWDQKYTVTDPIQVGDAVEIYLGRGSSWPLILTGRVEQVEPESTALEHHIRIRGRCVGEKLFRRVVTKTYENMKGEEIVKDLIDSYVGLSHFRDGVDLIEDTDTTYTLRRYENVPVFDILKYIAGSADKNGVIGYDFRIEHDGKFAFFPKNSKSSPITLAEKIEHGQVRKDIHRIRNKITAYGARLKSYPQDHDKYTEQNDFETPADDGWTGGTLSWNTSDKYIGDECVQCYFTSGTYIDIYQSLPDISYLDCDAWKKSAYSFLHLLINLKSTPNPDGETTVYIQLYAPDVNNRFSYLLTAPAQRSIPGENKWYAFKIPLGPDADGWTSLVGSPDWTQIASIRFYIFGINNGAWTVLFDGFYFGGRRFENSAEDSSSQSAYGLRELVEVDDELYNDNECLLRANALLDHLSLPAEVITLRSSILDYGEEHLLSGDKILVLLPNENVDADYRMESIDFDAKARDHSLVITLRVGKERPLLADYLYGLRSGGITLEKVTRTKTGD